MGNLEEQMAPVCGSKKKKKEPHSHHFQFSTLMNHNQINHKLLPKFQTVNMGTKAHLAAGVGLFGEETAS